MLEVGMLAAAFHLPRLNHGEVALAEILTRGPALLAFFKINCPVCQLTLPYLERVHQAGTLPVYGISQNGPRDTQAFADRYKTTFPMLLDGEAEGYVVSNAYGISSVPTLFEISADGMIARVVEGWRRQEMAALGALREGDRVPEWKAG